MIRSRGYILEEKLEIARRYLIAQAAQGARPDGGARWRSRTTVLREIIDGYAREAGVRSLENNIKKILRKSVKRIVEDRRATSVNGQVDDLPRPARQARSSPRRRRSASRAWAW